MNIHLQTNGEAHFERFGLLYALGGFALTRVLVFAVAFAFPTGPKAAGAAPRRNWWSPVPLMRWDAGHYMRIAAEGYGPAIDDTTAFFPAFPLLARPLIPLFGPDWACVVAGSITGVLAILLFYTWARRICGGRHAVRAVWLLSSYPPAMFLSTGYPQGLLLICAAGALPLVEQGRWPFAAILAGVASGTHPTGLALGATLALWSLCQRPPAGWARRFLRAIAVGLIALTGLFAHALNLWRHYDRPDAYFAAQSTWKPNPENRELTRLLTLQPVLEPSLRPLKYAARGEIDRLRHPLTWNMLLNNTLVVVAVLGLRWPGRIPRPAFLVPLLVFLMAYLPDPFTGTRMTGISRYQLMALPCFLWLAQCPVLGRRKLTFATVVAALLLLQGFYVHAYCRWELAS